MFIDMHAHTGEISMCCRVGREEILKRAKQNGFDGVVITNHYTASYFDESTHSAWLESYIEDWNECRRIGEGLGLKVFCGIEVTYEASPMVHLLIYGADEKFLRSNPFLCSKTQEELYLLCRDNGCVLVQAHPFRNGSTVMDTELLDGIEINCHPLYKNSYSEKLIEIANECGLALTVGCDYHADTYRPVGGMLLPDDIENERQLADFIRKRLPCRARIHEPATGAVTECDI